jgi:hypothetical protein
MKFFFTLCSFLVLLSLSSARSLQSENPEDETKYHREFRLIFFAVLEGLYEDGVAGEALELIIPDERGMMIDDAPEKTNFVYACPICTPTFDALRLYKSRSPFYAQKSTKFNTFGLGVSDEVMKELRGTPQQRRNAIEKLINKWIQKRLNNTKLTDCEREQIEKNLSSMRKKGEKMLKLFQSEKNYDSFRKHYENWKKCAACSGVSPLERWLVE